MTMHPTIPTEKIALVTGASRGLGEAVGLNLAAVGMHVMCVARDITRLEALNKRIAQLGGSSSAHPANLADAAAVKELGSRIAAEYGRVDVVVGNAGILGPHTSVTSLGLGELRDVIETNFIANYHLLAEVHPLLLHSSRPRLLFITAGTSREPYPGLGAYAASKAALEAMIRTYAIENAGTRIVANLFNPGPMATDMLSQLSPALRSPDVPQPEEVARAVLPLLAEDFDQTGRLFDFPTRTLI